MNQPQPTIPIIKIAKSEPQPLEKRKERADKGQPRITPRDKELLKFIGEQYTIRLDQLVNLINQNQEDQRAEKTIRNLIDRWRLSNWVTVKKIYTDQPLFVWLTKEGLEIAELNFRHHTPSPNMLNHYTIVNQVRLKLKLGKWRSERYLWAELTDEERRARKHIADGEIITPSGQIQAVEVELTAKHSERVKAIVDTLLDKYAVIYYFCTSGSQTAVEKAVNQLKQQEKEKIKIITL